MTKSQDISFLINFSPMKKYILEILYNSDDDVVEYIREQINESNVEEEEHMRETKFEVSPDILWIIDKLECLREAKPKEYTQLMSLALVNGNLIGNA